MKNRTKPGRDTASPSVLRDRIRPYLFILPGFALFAGLVIIPLLQTVALSLTDWNGLGTKTFVGLQNFVALFKDEMVLKSLKNNLLWAVCACTIPILVGLIQANLLVNKGIKHSHVFQLILFLPQILSSVVVSVIWTWIYSPTLGPLNKLFEMIGLEGLKHSWLGESGTVMLALLVMFIWMAYGFNTVVYSAAMQNIDPQLYEAAMLDGCSERKCFYKITIPCVRKTSTTLLLFALIDSFKVFDIVYQMTKGGPGYSSYVISYYIYNEAFTKNHVGYAATMAVMLTVIVLIVSKIFLKVRERDE